MACGQSLAEPKPKLLVSIQPLALIAEQLLGDSVELSTLLPPGATPHGFQLSVSQRRSLGEADLLVWVGPGLESFLGNIAKGQSQLRLDQLPSMVWPSGHQHEAHHDHNHGDQDPHLWLSPDNALVIARGLVAQLSATAARPEQIADWQQKLAIFEQEVASQARNWRALLSPFDQQPWLLYHDALSHFQTYFGLQPYKIITLTPERQPGARHLYELRTQIQPGQCLLVEQYYPTTQAKRLAEEFKLKQVSMDPLGVDAKSYSELMTNLVGQVAKCLGNP